MGPRPCSDVRWRTAHFGLTAPHDRCIVEGAPSCALTGLASLWSSYGARPTRQRSDLRTGPTPNPVWPDLTRTLRMIERITNPDSGAEDDPPPHFSEGSYSAEARRI